MSLSLRIFSATLLIAALVIGIVTYRRLGSKPNVLIITIDTTRADHLGCYGFALAHTPAIDLMAAEGARCTNAVSSAPITMPSHTSIFTGLFPPAHGVRDNGTYALGDDAFTLAERLRDAGYTTHAFVSALVLNRRYNLNQGFETYDDDLWAEDDPKLFMIRERQAPKTADRFLQWLGDWNRKRAKPFFTWIHFFDPHQPYRASPADRAISVTPYDAEITGVDRQIGRIVDTLRKDDLLDDTLLVITADHGESLGEHGELTHAIFVYDATVHVPLIIRYPRLFEPRVYEGPVRSVDIAPTVLDALRLKGGGMDGRSLVDALRGKEPPPQLPQYSESLLSEVGFGMAPLYALRDGGFKYIRAPRPELYDLQRDPGETKNIIGERPRIAAQLDAKLTEVMKRSSQHAVKAAVSPVSRETEESLQALGYLAPRAERNAMHAMDPKDGLPLHNKLEEARHLAQQKKWSEAEKPLLEILAITPRNISALNVLALVSVNTGDVERAKSYYQQSLAIDPNQFRVYGVLGSLELAGGQFDAAAADFQKALAVNHSFAEAYANLGFIESLKGRATSAEEYYRKGVAADPTFPRVYRRLGDLYYDRGDFSKAYEFYTKALQLLPSDVRAMLQAGNSARRIHRDAESDALFRRAEALRPNGWVPTYNRACLLAANGKPEQALQLLQSLGARHPLSLTLLAEDPDLASVRALPGYAALRRLLTDQMDDEDVAEGDG